MRINLLRFCNAFRVILVGENHCWFSLTVCYYSQSLSRHSDFPLLRSSPGAFAPEILILGGVPASQQENLINKTASYVQARRISFIYQIDCE